MALGIVIGFVAGGPLLIAGAELLVRGAAMVWFVLPLTVLTLAVAVVRMAQRGGKARRGVGP